MSEHAADRALPPARQEKRDVGLRFILGLFALIGGTLVALLVLVMLVFPTTLKDQHFAGPFPDFPAPRLQPDPPADMQAFQTRELARLDSTGWIDRKAGSVHIPIAQAMRAIAAEGIPGWPTQVAPGLASNGGRP